MALLVALLCLAGKIVVAPNIGLPINSQIPPVARISKPFSFTFSESTFSSSIGIIDYAVTDTPAWLLFDPSNRTLSGTPGPDDAGSPKFHLAATDTTGSTAMPVTLVVSTSAGPGLGTPVGSQLSAHNGFQEPDTLLLPHSSALSVSFSPDTFVNTNPDTVYYAMCANNTPLPSWITFDTASLSFSGTAPQNTSPDELPQTFGIQFTASDVVGFAAAVAFFRVTVENHILMFEKEHYEVNMTPGQPFNYHGLQGALRLNGIPVDQAVIRQIHLELPSWISFDESTWVLSGLPPHSANSQNVSVAATDIYGEIAVTAIVLLVETDSTADLFNSTLGTVNAAVGEEFEYEFNRIIANAPDAVLAVDLGPASSWLKFDHVNQKLSGSVPRDLQPQDIVLNVTLSQGSKIQSEPLTISIQNATHSANGRSTDTPGPSTSSSSAVASSVPVPSSQQTASSPQGNSSRVAAAIAVPVITICLLLILGCCIVARRRRRKTERDWLSEQKRKVSRPFLFDELRDEERTGALIEKPPPAFKPPSRAPIIDLPGFRTSMASKRHSWLRLSKATTDEAVQTPKIDSWQEYMQGLSMGKPRRTTQPQFSLLPEEQASSLRGKSRISSSKQLSRSSRPSGITNVSTLERVVQKKRKSDMSFASSGLLPSQRLSGFGHGRNGSSLGTSSCFGWGPIGRGHGKGGPPGFGSVKRSWRDPSLDSWHTIKTSDPSSSNISSRERSQNMGSTMRLFPRPPTSGTPDHLSEPPVIYETEDSHRRSIRVVEQGPPQTYGLSLHAFNKQRARNRQRRNTFFAANPSSRLSSHLDCPQSMHSPMLSSTQSTDSTTSMASKRRNSRLERSATRRTYSRSSSIEPPISSPRTRMKPRPSPRKRTSGTSNNNGKGLGTLISDAINRHFESGKSSISSSQHFGSTASGELNPSPVLGLEEHEDEEGNRRWRHRDVHPNPLRVHTPGDTPQSESPEMEEELFEDRYGRTVEGVGGRLQRLSFLRQQGVGGRFGMGESGRGRVVVGGSRGKRPVSVDNGLIARGASMRGDLVGGNGEGDGDVAFL
ncbi:MAG: hypothetical protein Q9209_000169 [Squamulea sp. 1 TL-2023]